MAMRPSSRLWWRLWQISRAHQRIPLNLQRLTGTHWKQFEVFQFFIKGMRAGTHSRYTWQGWWYHTTGVSAQFLGTHQTKKERAVEPLGATAEEQEKNKKSAKLFIEFLHSSMDHPVFQQCRIYQLEEIRIKAGETPDDLVEQIWGLADRCNFPQMQRRKAHPVPDGSCPQWHWPDKEAVGYEDWSNYCWNAAVCHIHITIADKHVFNGPINKAVSALQKMTKKPINT